MTKSDRNLWAKIAYYDHIKKIPRTSIDIYRPICYILTLRLTL